MNEEIIENLNKELDSALERGRKIVEDEDLQKRVEDLKQRAELIIRKHPVKSVAGGLLFGFIIGKILSSDD